jgi:tetratricopeptide (TPR) repeat protein/TolB-like protein
MLPADGMRFGRYELLARLGAGGMGEVWRARDFDLQRDVAVKFLPEQYAADPLRLERFANEARAASALNHPNIVTVHDVDKAARPPFIVMELVLGQTLRALVAESAPRPLSNRRLLEIGGQLADGLAKAHQAGIVHRDLKPENVMVTPDGFVKILDFGLAKLRSVGTDPRELWFDSAAPTWPEPASPRTAAGAVLGTVGYMSPEQARGRAVDHRSDQFSFGAILYELATGRQAFRRESAAQTIAAIIEAAPEPLSSLAPRLPPPVRWVIERCLAKEPQERYASTQDLARELRNLRERLPETGSGSSGEWPTRPAFDWRRTARLGVLAGAILAVAWLARESFRAFRAPSRAPVVAVLPLTNLTGQPEYDATAAGIAEVVVSGLTAIDGIQVLSRLATTGYRDRKGDLPAIGRELDASYLVDGVLQRSNQQLRVSFSLVQLPTNVVRWSGTFDGAFPQLFDLQSRVADGVATALRVSVAPPLREKIEARPTASPSAWESYTKALALLDRKDRPGNVTGAVSLLEQAIAADPRFALAQAAMARACLIRYREIGDASWADRGRDAAQEALRLDPRDVEVRLSLAMILASRGRRAEAIDELRRAIATSPRSDDLRRQLSEVLVSAGQPQAALEQAQEAVALRPGFVENQRALGWVHFSAGRFAAAADAYRRATELQPDSPWAFQMLGTSLHMAGDLKGAEAAYKEAIRLAPDARAWSNLGSVYYVTGRLPDAVRAYQEAARIEPASGTIRRSLGDARAKSGDAAAAKADWKAAVDLSREALRVNPRDVRQLKNVAVCLAKLGERKAALEAAQQALEAGPESADAHYGAAVVHALIGDAPGALAFLEKALTLGASASLAKQDDDLASLRGSPEFRKLLERATSAPAEEVPRAS